VLAPLVRLVCLTYGNRVDWSSKETGPLAEFPGEDQGEALSKTHQPSFPRLQAPLGGFLPGNWRAARWTMPQEYDRSLQRSCGSCPKCVPERIFFYCSNSSACHDGGGAGKNETDLRRFPKHNSAEGDFVFDKEVPSTTDLKRARELIRSGGNSPITYLRRKPNAELGLKGGKRPPSRGPEILQEPGGGKAHKLSAMTLKRKNHLEELKTSPWRADINSLTYK